MKKKNSKPWFWKEGSCESQVTMTIFLKTFLFLSEQNKKFTCLIHSLREWHGNCESWAPHFSWADIGSRKECRMNHQQLHSQQGHRESQASLIICASLSCLRYQTFCHLDFLLVLPSPSFRSKVPVSCYSSQCLSSATPVFFLCSSVFLRPKCGRELTWELEVDSEQSEVPASGTIIWVYTDSHLSSGYEMQSRGHRKQLIRRAESNLWNACTRFIVTAFL